MKHSIHPGPVLHYQQAQPRAALATWRPDALPALLVVDFDLYCHWLPQSPLQALTAIYLQTADGLQLAVTDATLEDAVGAAPGDLFASWMAQHSLAVFRPGQVLPLAPRFIPKPWGQEIWFTGVEERGVCAFACGAHETPIPWLQAVMPGDYAGPADRDLVLLKILDPLPEPVRGDLYFELHEEKREVYVVTHVDPQAWPDGVGAIRYGFDPAVRATYSSDAEFSAAYLAAVAEYEQVRRAIDAAVASEGQDPDLLGEETRLRAAMDRFTYLKPLRVGDVVKVPLRFPHSLQHGVRTVEFQTPVYERKILSFAQRVLTQDHWDTREAAQIMLLAPPAEEPFERLLDAPGLQVERVVDFEDFEVQRLRIEAGRALDFTTGADYALVMVVSGSLRLQGASYTGGEALFLPPGEGAYGLEGGAAGPLVLLLARPR